MGRARARAFDLIPPTPVPNHSARIRQDPNSDGALAQLGERLHGMQEVSGSIPLCSTITSAPTQWLVPTSLSAGVT